MVNKEVKTYFVSFSESKMTLGMGRAVASCTPVSMEVLLVCLEAQVEIKAVTTYPLLYT